jgi:hypothetical protein
VAGGRDGVGRLPEQAGQVKVGVGEGPVLGGHVQRRQDAGDHGPGDHGPGDDGGVVAAGQPLMHRG